MKTASLNTATPALALSTAIVLLLAGCGDKPAEAGKAGGMSAEEAMAEMKAEAVKMRPGQYRTEIRIETLDMPQAEGMPPQMMENFKASMQAAMQPTESCVTQEMADRGAEQVISQGQQNCRFEKLEMDGGKFDAAMVCTPEQGGEVRSTVTGTMTETRSEFRTSSEVNNPQMPGTMKMVLGFVTERIGDCPEAAPTAGMAMVSPSSSSSPAKVLSSVEEEKVDYDAPRLPMSALTPKQRRELEAMLTEDVQRYVDVLPRLNGQGRSVKARVTLQPERSVVIVDFTRNFLPGNIGGEWEDLTHQMGLHIEQLLIGKVEYGGTLYTIDGIDVVEYFPEEKAVSLRSSKVAEQLDPVVAISAGHGVYYSHLLMRWTAQRDPYNGITEDFVTPEYASELAQWFGQRSTVVTRNDMRSSSNEQHAQSGQPWWKVAARYHLQAQLPNNPEIWNSLPNSTAGDRERQEDIRSRPLYANFIGADALIHLHTDGATSPVPRGTRAYVQPGRPVDNALAGSILCSMKEIIQAQAGYAQFPVEVLPRVVDKGENRLADMPSVIVETAFHTNPDDALALQDPAFRTASMKGVEKGYRLHREGKPCKTFAALSMVTPPVPQNTPHTTTIEFEGNPQFPVKIEETVIACPRGWRCRNGLVAITEPTASPIVFQSLRCTTTRPLPDVTFRLRTVMVDADGVKSAPYEHSFTCTRPAA